MTKQIKNFAKRSGLLGRKFMFGKYYEDELTPEQIKFAEMIIRKCVLVADEHTETSKVGDKILQAFKD